MSKKKLPDHRIRYDSPLVEFSEAQIQQLRKEYGFLDTYDLEKALDNAATFCEQKDYYSTPPPVADQRKLLNAVAESARDLKKAVRMLGPSEISLLGQSGLDWSRHQTIDAASSTVRIAEIALTELAAQSGPGRHTRERERHLIATLQKIYQEGTGKHDRYSRNPDTHEHTGNLVSFIEEIITHFPVSVTNEFLGSALKRRFKG